MCWELVELTQVQALKYKVGCWVRYMIMEYSNLWTESKSWTKTNLPLVPGHRTGLGLRGRISGVGAKAVVSFISLSS